MGRKRKWEGASWTPPSVSAIVTDGAWCRKCKQRHGYKNALNVTFEKRKDGFWELWSCKKTGNVIEEMKVKRDG